MMYLPISINSIDSNITYLGEKMKFAGKLAMGMFIIAVALIAVSVAQDALPNAIPQAIVFEDTDYGGNHRHFFASVPDLTSGSNEWNDDISSIVVIYGNWTFLANPVGAGGVPNPSITLGPGVYPDVTKEAMQQRSTLEDNSISQVRLNSAL
jgi:hypothetical protein